MLVRPSFTPKLRLFDETLTHVPGTFLDAALQYIVSCIQTSQRKEFITMISSHVGEKGFVSIADSFRQEGHQKGLQKGHQKGLQKGLQEGQRKGREQGQQETMLRVARNFLASGLDVDFVAENTGLDVAFLKQLQEKTKH